MGIDLLRQREQWNEELKKLKAVFSKEEVSNTAGAMKMWRGHWEHQLYVHLHNLISSVSCSHHANRWCYESMLNSCRTHADRYKAFDMQYRTCLETLDDNLLDISVDMIFSNKQLQYRPALQDLRSRYYKNLNKFLDLPKSFSGLNDGGIYSSIPERNAEGLRTVYESAELLFNELRQLLSEHEQWVLLGTVDVEEWCDTNLRDVEDWEVNFKALKQKRKDAERLAESRKVGCFRVSLMPFKGAVEDQMHRLSDALMLSLRKSTNEALKEVTEYLDSAMERLRTVPHSVEDMGKAKQEWRAIADRKREFQRKLVRCQKKNLLLRQMTNTSLDMSAIKPKWEQFQNALDAFNDLLEDQRDTLKQDIERGATKCQMDIDKFSSRWNALKPKLDGSEMTQDTVNTIISEISDWENELEELVAATKEVISNAEAFEMPAASFDSLEEVERAIADHKQSWALYGEFASGLLEMSEEAWVAFRARIFNFEDFLNLWAKKLKGRDRDTVYDYIEKQLKIFRAIWPVLRKVTGELFENEHWKLLFNRLNFASEVTLSKLTLGHFIASADSLLSEKQAIEALAARAQGEVTIREAVQELRVWAEQQEFTLLEHVNNAGKQTHLIKEWKDLFTKLSDQQSLVSSLKESPYFAPFADQATQLAEKLALLDVCLHSLNQIQRKWVYLEPIFGRGSLPQEQARFQRIDEEFRDIMETIASNPNVVALASTANLEETTTMLLDQLNRCQKALNDFLEEKRSKLPRFYFIGDDDLLEILGQSQNPVVIQSHLKKLFGGIHTVEFSEDKKKITAMKSAQGETVQLLQPVAIVLDVEDWLSNLAVAMEETLTQLLQDCVKVLDHNKFPSQILSLAEMVMFTQRVEQCFGSPGALKSLHAELAQQLSELTSIDASDSRLLQLKLQALVMDLIHNMDVVEELIKGQVDHPSNWLWQKQLRYYMLKDGRCVVRMCDAEFKYSYEYQGNAPRLVHTPLTDKCYLVLTQGMHLGYGGNPYGPAGTGKTESVKALGMAMGRQVLVFNCDEGIDFQSMGRIFTGLVKSGAWGCFDEFNRLKEDQLSAVSQQIQVIQAALKRGTPTCDLLGKTINVNGNAAIFVTMNPASKEYGGRSKLPHNLKQLFRSVAMSVPDVGLIAKVLLYSEGFQYAAEVGYKLVEVYTLAKQLLSAQKHYDWGLRAMKTVLRHGGQLIHAEKKAGREVDVQVEMKLLIGALRINTLSKLTYDDSVRFNQLVNDVFPGQKVDDVDYVELEEAIRVTMQELHLEESPAQVSKILQLHAALNQRMGVVIVGPSGSGKTTILKCLHGALAKLGKSVVRHVMNPKALDRTKLLGHMDQDTREWFDGVLTASARQVMKEPMDVHSWVICDGDIDPEWIESLNSVLDDNHLLTMPNGERIKFGDNVNFVFESHDLQFASPATISRMGMIFLSEKDVMVDKLVQSWVYRQPAEMQDTLKEWLDEFFFKALDFVLAQPVVVTTTKVGTVNCGLSQLRGATSKGEFVIGLIRGMGGNLGKEHRANFAREVFGWLGQRPPDHRAPLHCYYNKQTKGFAQYTHEESRVPPEALNPSNPPVVTTIDVQMNRDIVTPWLENAEPFIVVGPEGCGKNLLLRAAFARLKGTSVTTLHCSARTDASHVVQKLGESCKMFSTTKGRVYRPKGGGRLVLFLKDINLPKPDDYETIQLIAFLQQLITYHGFYDDNLDWVGIEKVQVACSMNPATTVGRHALSTRFTAIVNVLSMTYPERDQLLLVYESFFGAVLQSQPGLDSQWKSAQAVRKLAGSTIDLYEKLCTKFSVDDHRHYLFNPRDLTEWSLGLLRYDLGAVSVLDVWTYEASRMFCDRLVGSEAIRKFRSLIASLLRSQWKFEASLTDMYYTGLANVGVAGDGADASTPALASIGPRLDMVPAKDFKTLVETGLKAYEREFKDLNILLFPEILDHIAFEDRVLSRPGGSLLLVGDSGVGRRSSVTVVCYMLRMEFFSPNITQTYDGKSFRADLKEVLKQTGVEGKQVMLFLEDHQLVVESILEDTNSLLAAGEVPGVFQTAELDQLLAPLKEEFANDNEGFKTVTQLFVHRVQQNLRVCLSMDPSHPQFGVRCESNPALYTKCTVLWMGRWSSAGMASIPQMRLQSMLNSAGEVDHEVLLDAVQYVHKCVPKGATPSKYVAFLETYIQVFTDKQKTVLERKKHLESGLHKLHDAGRTVDELTQEATQKKALVTQKQGEADNALERITESMAKASDRRVEVEQLQRELGGEEQKLQGRREAIQAELADIQPILDQAREAVSGIKKEHINEMKALRMPPTAIRDVLAGVLTLMRQQDLSWNSMRKFLSSAGVVDAIVDYDAKTINSEMRQKVLKLIKENPESFEKSVIYRVSKAAGPLAEWVTASVKYSAVLHSIKPLQQELESAESSLNSARTRLVQCEAELQELDSAVKELKERFAKTTGEAESLKVSLAHTTEVLSAAQELLGKLSGERSRWEDQVKGLNENLRALPFHALLAAAFITYLGGFPEDIRTQVMKSWTEKMGIRDFDFRTFLSSESELLKWKAEGLPADDLSVQNGLILEHSVQPPFVIDPNQQASAWLKDHLKDKTVEVVMQQDQRFVTTLELAVRFGKILIIQEADGVLPLLYPVLRRDLMRQGPRWVVQVGDKTVDYNENFRVFLVTRNSAPDLPANALALTNLVNFTVTRSGLEGQFLGITLNHEKPELEQQKSALLAEEDGLKIQQDALEKSLLQELANSQGNILENKALVESLNQTKTQSIAIAKALRHSHEVQDDLDKQREVYRPIAHMGSLLYFLLAQLSSVNNMYEYSLPMFIELFNSNMDPKSESSGRPGSPHQQRHRSTEERVQALGVSLKLLVLQYVTRSLFKADRLMFGMHMLHCLHPQLFQPNEWEFFIGELVSDVSFDPSGTGNLGGAVQPWVSRAQVQAFSKLCAQFPTLARNCNFADSSNWSHWASNPQCELDFPATSVSPFQRLLVIQALRPDRMLSALQNYTQEALGVVSMSPPPLSLQVLLNETRATEPVLFVTTAGADPTQELEEFAEKVVGKGAFRQLAMGSGQTDAALESVHEAAKAGSWLVLKNLHLVTPWLSKLEKTIKQLKPHPNFRLWLTTEAHPKFPPILLQQSLKITYESPPGVKQNLLRTYAAWDASYIARGSVVRAQLLFTLAWFHAVVQERRTYLPQGWTKFYEFSFADLRSGADIIDSMSDRLNGDPSEIPWTTVWGLMKFAIYGGRIDNDHDVRVLVTYLHKFFHRDILVGKNQPGGRQVLSGLDYPQSNQKDDYMRLIHNLPDTDAPQLFGLASNADGSVQESTSVEVTTQLRKLLVSSSASSKFSRESWKAGLKGLMSLWEKASSSHDRAILKPTPVLSKASDFLSPVESFIVLEAELIYDMIKTIHTTMSGLASVLYSTGLLSPAVAEAGVALLNGGVPSAWRKHWWGPETAAQWIKQVVTRRLATIRWVQRAETEQLLSQPLHLPDLMRPRVFLNALRQQTARQKGKPIDSVALTCSWDRSLLPQSALLPVAVDGLLLSGCGFASDMPRLAPLSADAPKLVRMPQVYFAYVDKSDPDPYPDDGCLAVPLYFSTERDEFVCDLKVPCKGHKGTWILSGTAIALCDM